MRIVRFLNAWIRILILKNACNHILRLLNAYFKASKHLKTHFKAWMCGIKSNSKGNLKLTARQKWQFRQEAPKSYMNCHQIINYLDFPIHNTTVSRVLNASSSIKSTKPKPNYQHNRLNFAKKRMHWTDEWRQVIFSEEKKFYLDDLVCQSLLARSKRNFGCGTAAFLLDLYKN